MVKLLVMDLNIFQNFNLVTFIDMSFLVAIFFSVIWIFSIVSGYGGEIGKSLKMIGWGVVLMGISYFVEIWSLTLPDHHEAYLIVFFHHLLSTIGFLIIAFGFKKFIKK
ncbi:MAG: hypothetical protein UR79_C0004G0025 [Candidatus Campbellbacteria bacterium GW2011_GWD1_35_49]|jgi:hypothetical protein|nr:MAG: hypothetical protein UR74_C0004G0025 [Candidatus Campbellbacteria bacterium GW2011_GWD2_35_24]KKP76535.1 MAG: hypothetical protein UR76_C0004G0025 [Candidatus Campbellbacteria bacterium GW2011_GWC1_35_31]KKP78574.1 MAG: hypothetical protein UR79_C0004G0025 [Candidatus Campbellbacteria bacterium GW2011_GWD1_35_49]